MSPAFMSPALIYRVLFLVVLVAALEVLCLVGAIDNITMPPPHRIFTDLVHILWTGRLNAAIVRTLSTAVIACVSAIVFGVIIGALLHPLPRVRRMLDPFFSTYYAVPVLAFYPIFIVVFGLNDMPQIIVGFMLGVVTVVVNTLDGLDRVPRVLKKVARIEQLGPVATALRVTLPFAIPFISTGAKLAVSYSLVGVIASEFIMSRAGIGHEISYAYLNFDNATMYPLILFLIIVAAAVNMALYGYERLVLRRRGLIR